MTMIRILLLLWLVTGLARAQTSVGTYGAFWSGLPVGVVTLENRSNNTSYAFTMTLVSGGILGSRFITTFSGSGAIRGDRLIPSDGRFSDTRRGETRTETIRFNGNLPSFTSTPAYIIPEEFQFDLERTRGALDPSSGLFALLHAAASGTCGSTFRIYDGFSLFRARIRDEGVENIRTNMYSGVSQKCSLSLEPIAGKAAVYGSFTVPEMEINVAQVRPGTPFIPVRGALIINGKRGATLPQLFLQLGLHDGLGRCHSGRRAWHAHALCLAKGAAQSGCLLYTSPSPRD